MKLSRTELESKSVQKVINCVAVVVLLLMIAPLIQASEKKRVHSTIDLAILKESAPVARVKSSAIPAPLACPDQPEPFSQIYTWQTSGHKGSFLRIIGVARNTAEALSLRLFDEHSTEIKAPVTDHFGHYPRAARADFDRLAEGRYRAVLLQKNSKHPLACHEFEVTAKAAVPPKPAVLDSGIWKVTRAWDPQMEDLFSVFIARLFYVPPGIHKGWKDMQTTVYNPARNILHGLKGLDEDNPNAEVPVKLRPDCADAPYQLRAYFAWKLGLPYGFHSCTRGTSERGARCPRSFSNRITKFDDRSHPVDRFNIFAKEAIVWRVHAGNLRTRPEMDNSDFYSVALDPQSIRPGTVFVDAGGHVILVTQWTPQKDIYLGELFGIDAHPDRTVTHKRFAPGTFIFNHRVPTDGFKAFRPVIQNEHGTHFMTNDEINASAGFIPQSDAQSHVTEKVAFYDKVFSLLNPNPVNPINVLKAKIEVLHSAMLERVQAVEVGFDFMRDKNWPTIPMPAGAAIFQTEGLWEIYSTPARDLRVFIALDDAVHFPARVAQNPGIFETKLKGTPEEVLKQLQTVRDEALSQKSVSYTRSDGSQWTLSLLVIIQRQEALEMSYNPNDCPEIRWAAPINSEEISTCQRTAPEHQTQKMLALRTWFAKRKRPDQ